MMQKRMKPKDRKAEILSAAVAAAQALGFTRFRLVDVAAKANCSTALVIIYWSTMEQIRRAVMREAIRIEALPILAVGIAIDDPRCRKMSHDLAQRAIASLNG